jgi:cyanophycin synthetase
VNPETEIRLTALQATRGPNYWSSRPITRLDIVVGAYETVSSAEVAGLTEALVEAMPGLEEHRCSIGERGGFILRLRRGTYAPHIIEHVALELQSMIGHEVGYGRTRGGEAPGEYTVVVEHLHDGVGLRAAALALEIVQRAFAGTLDSIDHEVAELHSLAATPPAPPIRQRVLCGITGGSLRAETRDEIVRRGAAGGELIVDVAPGYILQAGLPYAGAAMAVITDAEPLDVPERYRERTRARRLVSVVVDPVDRGGIAIVPASEWEVQEMVHDARCLVAVFTAGARTTPRDAPVAWAAAFVERGRVIIERRGERTDAGPVRNDVAAEAQVAGALAAYALRRMMPADTGGAAAD